MKDDALPPKLFVEEVVLMTLIELAFGMLPTLDVQLPLKFYVELITFMFDLLIVGVAFVGVVFL